MKKKFLGKALILACACSMLFTSCIGNFALTSKVLTWNKQVGSKFVNELVFFLFWPIPVYPLSFVADVLVINSIEFWSGKNPVTTASTKVVDGENGRFIVKRDKKGYTIKSEFDKSVVRFEFNEVDNSWAYIIDGQSHTFMTFVDDTHVKMLTPAGDFQLVELSQAGVYAYRDMVTGSEFAMK